MAAKKIATKTNSQYIDRMAKRLGISPEKVLRAVDNLLYGDGAVYRQVITIPLHGLKD